jgi:hypothetical protein
MEYADLACQAKRLFEEINMKSKPITIITKPSEQLPPKRKDGLNSDLAKYISGMAFKLALTEEERNVSYLPVPF